MSPEDTTRYFNDQAQRDYARRFRQHYPDDIVTAETYALQFLHSTGVLTVSEWDAWLAWYPEHWYVPDADLDAEPAAALAAARAADHADREQTFAAITARAPREPQKLIELALDILRAVAKVYTAREPRSTVATTMLYVDVRKTYEHLLEAEITGKLPRGRKPGTTVLEPHEIKEGYYAAVERLKQHNGGVCPTLTDIAREMGIHPRTLQRYRNTYGLPYPP